MTRRRKHKAVRVRVGKYDELIDRNIAPLIRELWRAGIDTVMSCESAWYDWVWVQFSEITDVIRFLNIVARYESESGSLHTRMTTRYDNETEWKYEFHAIDGALLDTPDNEIYEGPPDFYFLINVRFPPTDLPEVVQRLEEHNRETRIARN